MRKAVFAVPPPGAAVVVTCSAVVAGVWLGSRGRPGTRQVRLVSRFSKCPYTAGDDDAMVAYVDHDPIAVAGGPIEHGRGRGGPPGMTVPVVLIPGAGGQGWIWHLVEADLRRRGYDAFAVDLPAAEETKGLPEYADAVVGAIGERAPVAIAAYSLGAFTAPLVWQRVPTRQVIFVNAMIPRPGETPGAWWDNVGWEQARTTAARRNGYPADFDLDTYFLHDVPPGLRRQMLGRDVPQSGGPFGDVCAFDGRPDVPVHAIAGRDDRFFPVDLQQRVARERLSIEPEVVPGGHLAALSHPEELAAALDRYLRVP